MIGVSYSVMGILAIVIHLIINRDMLFLGKQDSHVLHDMRRYQKFLWGVGVYYVTDTLWGILDGLGMVHILKIDTFVYYLAMSMAVVLWCDYVVDYLHQDNTFGKILKHFGRIFVAFEVGALIINIFTPIFFWFDEQGEYHAEEIRYLALYIQVVMFLASTIQAVFVTLRTTGVQKRRHLAICLFGLSMIIAIIAQIFYPLLPIYSIGYLVGTCFLHVFVEEDEKDEYFNNMQKQMDIISAMAGIHFCSYYVDMKTKTFIEIDNKIPENVELIGKSGDAVEILDKMCKYLVLPEYRTEMQEYTNLKTLDERLSGQNYYVSMQFKSVHLGWAEGYFIASDRDEDGKLNHVIWAIRTINDEKQKEEKLLYNSYIDELTGLYNRKMYAEDRKENNDCFMRDDFVYVSMDVNGLKVINDTKGHAAGDELIKGAASCMKKVMGKFGRIYRTGGDEFIALLNASGQQVEQIKKDFEEETANFTGQFVETISVSCGYVILQENQLLSFTEIEKLADEKMYQAKRLHYTANGVDRRSQQRNAYKALCAIYTKILIINLTEDTYSVICMDEDERSEDKGFSEGIFDWLINFATSDQVHPEDQEMYLAKTNKEFLTSYFKKGENSLSISYRRRTDGEFKLSEMEMIPTEDYSDENQSLYLYVKTE